MRHCSGRRVLKLRSLARRRGTTRRRLRGGGWPTKSVWVPELNAKLLIELRGFFRRNLFISNSVMAATLPSTFRRDGINPNNGDASWMADAHRFAFRPLFSETEQ